MNIEGQKSYLVGLKRNKEDNIERSAITYAYKLLKNPKTRTVGIQNVWETLFCRFPESPRLQKLWADVSLNMDEAAQKAPSPPIKKSMSFSDLNIDEEVSLNTEKDSVEIFKYVAAEILLDLGKNKTEINDLSEIQVKNNPVNNTEDSLLVRNSKKRKLDNEKI